MYRFIFAIILSLILAPQLEAKSSYSSGKSSGSSSSKYSSGKSKPSAPPSSSGGSKYSSGKNTPPSSPSAAPSNNSSGNSKPTKSFDSQGGEAAKKQESKTSFWNSKKKAEPTYQRPPVSDATTQQTKRDTFYRNYNTPERTVIIQQTRYRDSYNPYFWLWLMDRSPDERALWAYHHRNDMDQARYQEMAQRDTDLNQRIKNLEAQKIAADPNYKPTGVDNDLMYKTDAEMLADVPEESSNGWAWFFGIVSFFVIGGGIYLLAFKKWNA